MFDAPATGFVPLFDGRTLDGWNGAPRSYDTVWPGGPTVRSTSMLTCLLTMKKWRRHIRRTGQWSTGRSKASRIRHPRIRRLPGLRGDLRRLRAGTGDQSGLARRHRRHAPPPTQRWADSRSWSTTASPDPSAASTATESGLPRGAVRPRRHVDRRPANGLIEEDPPRPLEPITGQAPGLPGRRGLRNSSTAWRSADWNHLRIACVGRSRDHHLGQ